jgi:hypothetical protein
MACAALLLAAALGQTGGNEQDKADEELRCWLGCAAGCTAAYVLYEARWLRM